MTSQTTIVESTVTEQSVSKHPVKSDDARLFETVKHVYKLDHQAEYLEIKAQLEALLQQLQADNARIPANIQ